MYIYIYIYIVRYKYNNMRMYRTCMVTASKEISSSFNCRPPINSRLKGKKYNELQCECFGQVYTHVCVSVQS